jgi:RNA polymerase sigma-70 factor, ECF subfamily
MTTRKDLLLVSQQIKAPRQPHSMNEPSLLAEQKAATPGHCPAEWDRLIAQVKAGEDTGSEQLYKLFSRGVRDYLWRQLGPQELNEKVYDTFAIIAEAIRGGELRDSELLTAFIHRVAYRQAVKYIEETAHKGRAGTDLGFGMAVVYRRDNPKEDAIIHKKMCLMEKVLRSLSQTDRDILERFYLHEHSHVQICGEMSVTETQFRLLKSRVKVNLEERSRKSREQRNFQRSSKNLT